MTYIAYENDTKRILAFITTSDSIDTNDVFRNFENYSVITTELEIPVNYTNNKVVIDNDVLTGFELIENEVIE